MKSDAGKSPFQIMQLHENTENPGIGTWQNLSAATTQWCKGQPIVAPLRSWMFPFSQVHMSWDNWMHLLKGRSRSIFFGPMECARTPLAMLWWWRNEDVSSPPKVENQKKSAVKTTKEVPVYLSADAWTTWRKPNWMHWLSVLKSWQ